METISQTDGREKWKFKLSFQLCMFYNVDYLWVKGIAFVKLVSVCVLRLLKINFYNYSLEISSTGTKYWHLFLMLMGEVLNKRAILKER